MLTVATAPRRVRSPPPASIHPLRRPSSSRAASSFACCSERAFGPIYEAETLCGSVDEVGSGVGMPAVAGEPGLDPMAGPEGALGAGEGRDDDAWESLMLSADAPSLGA